MFVVFGTYRSSPAQPMPQAPPTHEGGASTNVQSGHRLNTQERWQISGRYIRGAVSAALRAKAINGKFHLRGMQPLSPSNSGRWVSLGPRPLPSDSSGIGLQDYGFISGRSTAIAIDPNDPSGNTVFVAGAYAGIWKSTNAASPDPSSVAWTPLTDNQATLAIGSIAVQPQLSNPNPANSVVLAGTGETDSSTDSYYGLGILRSADGGLTWTLISQDVSGMHSFAGLGFSQITFSSTDPNLVVAAAASASRGIAEGLETPVEVNRGLYFSNNGGSGWQATSAADSGTAISPASATAVAYNAAAGKFYAAIRFHGFYSSADGVNWTRLPNQPGTGLASSQCPPQETLPSNCSIYRGEIAVVPNRPGTSGLGEMYVWYVDSNNIDQGIWSSLDGGITWSQIDDSGITNCGDAFGGCGTAQGAFDLTLMAVPDGTATDLYAGAVNIYKCTITNLFPTCNGTADNTFLNLTHVYGCSDIAKVYPNQHGMDFTIANGGALVYFANDGGVNRALNAYSGLTSGACGQPNQFDNLNETLGPMTQFVSLSESSSDPNLIFGGTEGSGSPATSFSQSGGNWVNVNAGNNGATAINPSSDGEWFVSSPPSSISGVNLFRCANGIDCRSQDFQNGQIADSNSLDGDIGPFNLPFLLDPQLPSSLLLGTCRIWRGPTSGGSFSSLSPDFETGGSGSCSGNEINLVRSLAVGGLRDPNGMSQVIYAGTDGEGPLISTTPAGGHVWVTTNANAGPLSWTDVTQSINPKGFPISSIALDQADPLGKTAYVAIMGFHTSHVWKTTTAGASWTDFTANLPDAPVNVVTVDSGNSLSDGTVYVGTDVGVFASSTGSANWTEVGPAAGQTGFLPNVAVTSLQVFNSGGLKRLRAATYGRGIWEWNLITTPDFELSVSNNPLTVFLGQTATFTGTALAVNGYSSNVNFSCIADATNPPQKCSTNPPSLTPSTSGTSFSVGASGAVGDYRFRVHAVGTDVATITHDLPLTLHIVDFSLSPLSPASASVTPGSASTAVSFQVLALGSFSGVVSLSCSGLPAGASCHFLPAASVSPTNGAPSLASLTIATLSTTPLGNFPVSISATATGAAAKTQTMTLMVNNSPDYSLAISNPSLTAPVNASVSFHGTLTSMNGYSSAVAIGCGTRAPPTCSVNPATIIPTSGGAGFDVTVSSPISQAYDFDVVASGSDPGAITHSFHVAFTAMPAQSFDFTMNITPASASTPAGQPANFSLAVVPVTGSFPNDVNFSCSKLPALTTCGFNPTRVGSGSENSVVQFTVSTTAPVAASSVLLAPTLSLTVAGFLFLRPHTMRISFRGGLAILATLLVGLSISCGGGLQGGGGGGGGSPGTPPGTYTVTVTAACGSLTHSTQVSLTVTP